MGWRGEGLGAPLDSRAQDPKETAQHRKDGGCPLSPENIRAFNETSSSRKPGLVSPDRRILAWPTLPSSPLCGEARGDFAQSFPTLPYTHTPTHTHTHTHMHVHTHTQMVFENETAAKRASPGLLAWTVSCGPSNSPGNPWIMPRAAKPPTLLRPTH